MRELSRINALFSSCLEFCLVCPINICDKKTIKIEVMAVAIKISVRVKPEEGVFINVSVNIS
jgi:hypothetical protein